MALRLSHAPQHVDVEARTPAPPGRIRLGACDCGLRHVDRASVGGRPFLSPEPEKVDTAVLLPEPVPVGSRHYRRGSTSRPASCVTPVGDGCCTGVVPVAIEHTLDILADAHKKVINRAVLKE